MLICSGFVGVFLYFGFFGWAVWRFRRDRTPEGMIGMLVLVLSFIYMLTYDAVAAPLGLTMLAYAVLWRNSRLAGPRPSGQRSVQMPRPRRLASRTTVVAGSTPAATAMAR